MYLKLLVSAGRVYNKGPMYHSSIEPGGEAHYYTDKKWISLVSYATKMPVLI